MYQLVQAHTENGKSRFSLFNHPHFLVNLCKQELAYVN